MPASDDKYTLISLVILLPILPVPIIMPTAEALDRITCV